MANGFDTITFISGAHNLRQLPPDEGVEVAFAGRSNAGKSSAINCITGHRSLARTSKTPGRTQLINLFEVAPNRRLADLPGYGYAKVPEKMRRHWRHALENYLRQRQSLKGLVLLMDVRHPLKDHDRAIVQWCAEVHMPLHVLLTKSDKLSRGAGGAALQKVIAEINRSGAENRVQLFSALKRDGVVQARDAVLHWLNSEPV